MSNTNTVIDMVANESLRLAHEKLSFLGTVDRSYDDSFAKSGAKIGSTLRVRNPNAYTRRAGSRVMNVQDTTETTQTITVATQDGVDLRWNAAELAMDIDEISKRYLEPAMSVLVAGIESDHLITATKATYNTVGTAGTVVGAVTSGFSDTSALGLARARLNQCLAPDDSRSVQMDSITMASISNGIKGLFLPQKEVENAWKKGFIGQSQMATFYENEKTWSLTNISDVTGTTDAAALVTDGGTAMDIHTTVASPAVGSVFTVAGVFACHYETKQSLGYLQQFTVVTTSAGAAIAVSPATILTGPKQNVCSAASAALATTDFDAKTLTFHGSASATYRQNLMYHKDAFAFVTADLPLFAGSDKCVRKQKDGLSIRVWQDGDIRNDELLLRIDILHGFKVLRPEWAVRISN
jgi:hypothetical protein